MLVNSYDDCKVSLRRPHGNGDLDIVLASYTRRKANVTELGTHFYFRKIVLYNKLLYAEQQSALYQMTIFSYLFSVDCLS